jgi:hypothetical protein
VVAMIAIVALGLAALAVLAVAVGLFDATQGAERRWRARDRRAAWEQRQREERMALARERFPDF